MDNNDKNSITLPDERRKRRGSGRPTIFDVAALAGVATTSVSRTLRNPELVSAKMKNRVNQAIKALGYSPDPSARALASSRADVICILVPSFSNRVFTEVIVGMYATIGESGYQIQLANSHYSNAEEERLLRMFLSQRPSGLIVAGIDQNETSRALLKEADCPVVQIMELDDNPIDMLVGFSHFDAGRTATEHLITNGYRKIAFLGARMDPRSLRRMAGYRYAMEAAGLYSPDLLTTTPAYSSIPLGCSLLADALSKRRDIDAVFCNNDDLALGVLFESQRRDMIVPYDLGICGFNDLDMMSASHPSLTSIRTPRREIGEQAIKLILDEISGNSNTQRVYDLGFSLIERESTKRLRP